MNRFVLRFGAAVVSALLLTAPAVDAFAGAPGAGSRTAGLSATPRGVSPVGPSILAIDQDHHGVVLVDPGQLPKTVVSGLTYPFALLADPFGAVFLLDAGTHQLIKADLGTGQKTVLRSHVASTASMAMDDSGNLFVLDNTAVLKYAAKSSRSTILGPTQPQGKIGVDGAGNASVFSPQITNAAGVRVKTFPAAGGAPTYRNVTVPADGGNSESIGYLRKAIEGRDGSTVLELLAVGGSGATFLVALNARTAAGDYVPGDPAEYAYAFDRASDFTLLQNRSWCASIARRFGCVDDYAVDSMATFPPGVLTPVTTPVTSLFLPVGGIARDDAGNTYGAILVSKFATDANDHIDPALVRIDPAGGEPTVLALGHFASPVVLGVTPAPAG